MRITVVSVMVDDQPKALRFYTDVLGGTSNIMTFGEMGMEGPGSDKVMHGQIETDHGITLMCSDFPPGEALDRGNGFTVSLSGDDADKLRGWFERLSEGGTIETPLEKQMWGDEFGMCTDRHGTPWMVNITQT